MKSAVFAAIMAMISMTGAGAQPMVSTSATTTYHAVQVNGLNLFYREAGPRMRRPCCCCTGSRHRRGCSKR